MFGSKSSNSLNRLSSFTGDNFSKSMGVPNTDKKKEKMSESVFKNKSEVIRLIENYKSDNLEIFGKLLIIHLLKVYNDKNMIFGLSSDIIKKYHYKMSISEIGKFFLNFLNQIENQTLNKKKFISDEMKFRLNNLKKNALEENHKFFDLTQLKENLYDSIKLLNKTKREEIYKRNEDSIGDNSSKISSSQKKFVIW